MIYIALNDTETDNSKKQGKNESYESGENGAYQWVYDDNLAIIDNYERYDEEWELPYIDDETFAVIKAAYEEIDFNGEFETGDPKVYDEYRWKFWELLQGRGVIWDQETGKELTILEFLEESFYLDEYDPAKQHYIYYFYDMDGDGCPELGIWETESLYFLRYNKELDRFSVWYKMGGWYYPLGTRKGICSPNLGNHNSYVLLDENADIECSIYFFHEYESRKDDLYMVTLPDYADKGREVEVTQEMKAQGAYIRSFEQWFFRVTEEQYDELTDPYYEAYRKGHHEREEVQYSYVELFGDFIQAESQGEEESVPNEAADSITEDGDHEEVSGFSLSDFGEAAAFIDYEFIQENHEILEYNICTSPRYDYADTILAEYLRSEIEEDERAVREFGLLAPIKIDYFTYDLNEDGLEDYLVCIDGYLWSGSGGNTFRIYVQEEEGTLRKIFSVTTRIHNVSELPGGHAPIAVLSERINDYYMLVLPGNRILPGSRILKYDSDSDCYQYDDFEF